MHFSCQEKEKKEKQKKIDHQWQSNHYKHTCATPCEKGHGCAMREKADDQIWSSGGVTRATIH